MLSVTRTACCVLIALALAATGGAGYEPLLDEHAIAEAIAMGQSRIDARRTRFYGQYRVPVSRAPVDYIEVVTPFRRVVLAAEARARVGDRPLGQGEARDALAEGGDQIELFVELTFHPHNTYLGVPSFDVALMAVGATAPPITPRNVQRAPRYGARVEGTPLLFPFPLAAPAPAGSQPLLGGTVIAQFDARLLKANGAYEVVLSETGKELARGRMNLATMRRGKGG